ncbi:MAG: hypothetical protein WCF84_14535 [Anaerolineae bacterium]
MAPLLSTRRLFVAILILALFAMGVHEVADPDFWWHLRTGEYIVENRAIPHTDIFSFTNPGKEWITHEWLSQVSIYLLYRAGGLPLLIVLFAGIITATFALAYWRSTGRPYIAGFVVILGALATAPTWGVRPQMLSMFLASLFLWLLDTYQSRPLVKYLIPLPIFIILWVNLHSGYALGLGILGIYLAGMALDAYLERRLSAALPTLRPLAIVLALCLVAVPLNPNGFRMFSYPLETLTSPAMQKYIQEWFSPDFHLLEFQPFAILLLALIGAGIVSRARIPATWLLLILIFGFASLRSARNIPFFALAAVPALASQFTAILQKPSTPHTSRVSQVPRLSGYLNPLLLIIIGVLVALRVLTIVDNQPQVEQKQFPDAAVNYIQNNKVQGNLYNTYGWGGYIIWRLYPQYQVYIDGRADVYGDQFIESYLEIYRAKPGWDAALAARGVNAALVEPDSAIAYAMATAADWQQVYADSHSILFIRK